MIKIKCKLSWTFTPAICILLSNKPRISITHEASFTFLVQVLSSIELVDFNENREKLTFLEAVILLDRLATSFLQLKSLYCLLKLTVFEQSFQNILLILFDYCTLFPYPVYLFCLMTVFVY